MLLWSAVVELRPGKNDEMFESIASEGGFIKVYREAKSISDFEEEIGDFVNSYGSILVKIENVVISDDDISRLAEWAGVSFGAL